MALWVIWIGLYISVLESFCWENNIYPQQIAVRSQEIFAKNPQYLTACED